MRAIYTVSQTLKIPVDVLGAVALTETGIKRKGKFTPWPWAINVAGKGYIFDNRKQAIAAAQKFHKQGKRSIDIGCMQMNWRWHKEKFSFSIPHAFDPVRNVMVAGKYLKEHYKTYGNWSKAIGRYHSGTKRYANRYLKKALVNRNLMRREFGLKPKNIPSLMTASISPKQSVTPPPKEKIIVPPTDFLPSAPIVQNKFLDTVPGALINFQHVGEALIALPEAPEPLLRRPTRRFIDIK